LLLLLRFASTFGQFSFRRIYSKNIFHSQKNVGDRQPDKNDREEEARDTVDRLLLSHRYLLAGNIFVRQKCQLPPCTEREARGATTKYGERSE